MQVWGLAALVWLLMASPAGAQGLVIERATTGPSGGNADVFTNFLLTSADGERAIFATDEDLVPEDTRRYFNFYERFAGRTRLLAQDDGRDEPRATMSLFGASADATRIVFYGHGHYAATDNDDLFTFDTYAAKDGVVEHVSIGGNENSFDAVPTGLSGDGQRVLFESGEHLTSDDTDYKKKDVFLRENGVTTRVSTGPNGGNHQDSSDTTVVGHSADARVVIMRSSEPFTPDDTDGRFDLFARAGGQTVKVSPGNGPYDVDFDAVSDDGSVVVFHTTERLTGDDVDDRSDAYRAAGGTLTRVSTGPNGGNDNEHNVGYELSRLGGEVVFLTPDGSRVLFTSYERLTPDDTDHQVDSYVWSAGGVQRVSKGPNGGNGEYDPAGWNLSAIAVGASADASHVVMVTRERLTADDTEHRYDLYEWANGQTRRVTAGPSGGNAEVDVVCPWPPYDYCGGFKYISTDGARIFFETKEKLVALDEDDKIDVYMRAGGVTTLLSPPRPGVNHDFDASFMDASLDGSIAYVQTEEQLTADDTDRAPDAFKIRTPAPGVILAGGVSGADGSANGGASQGGSTGLGSTKRVRLLARPRSLRMARGQTRLRRTGRGLPFSLESAAKVTLQFERVLTGRRVKGTCRRPAARLRRKPVCRRLVPTARPVTLSAPAGRSVLAIGTRVGRRGLRPGRYGLTLSADGGPPTRLLVRLVR